MGVETSVKINSDLQRVNHLQGIFNKKLGIGTKPIKLMNYNPVLARFKFEEVTTGEGQKKFRKYETFQVETALRERNRAAKSAINYMLDSSGEAYNELFPDEPFSVVLERGLAYRQSNGSKELMREKGEITGWRKIVDLMTEPNAPIGTKAVVVSGPGLIEDTNYHDNFVDVYELKSDPRGERFINMVRHSSSLSYDQYWNKLRGMDPNYFQDTNLPIDAWMLSHPLMIDPLNDPRSADQIFHQVFEGRKDSMSEADFQKLLVMCMPVINYYIDTLCSNDFKPAEIALAWNAVLKKSDMAAESILIPEQSERSNPFLSITQEVDWLGRQEIKTMAAGCGSSEGFEFNDLPGMGQLQSPVEKFLSNSVGKFDPDRPDKKKTEKKWFECPKCNYVADGPVGDKCPGCGLTKQQYSKEGGKVC